MATPLEMRRPPVCPPPLSWRVWPRAMAREPGQEPRWRRARQGGQGVVGSSGSPKGTAILQPPRGTRMALPCLPPRAPAAYRGRFLLRVPTPAHGARGHSPARPLARSPSRARVVQRPTARPDAYSARNASIGRTRVARCAGTNTENSEIRVTSANTAT